MSTATTYKLWLKSLVIVCGAGAVVLGALVQFGWHARIDWLLQLSPNQRAMQYNTALCFSAYGLGQLSLVVSARAGRSRQPCSSSSSLR